MQLCNSGYRNGSQPFISRFLPRLRPLTPNVCVPNRVSVLCAMQGKMLQMSHMTRAYLSPPSISCQTARTACLLLYDSYLDLHRRAAAEMSRCHQQCEPSCRSRAPATSNACSVVLLKKGEPSNVCQGKGKGVFVLLLFLLCSLLPASCSDAKTTLASGCRLLQKLTCLPLKQQHFNVAVVAGSANTLMYNRLIGSLPGTNAILTRLSSKQ